MSVYSLSRIPVESGAITVSDWHPSMPYLAVANNNSGRVTIYTEDGEKIYSFKRTEQCTSMKWHPRYLMLLCGWRSGIVTCATLEPNQNNRSLDAVHASGAEVSVIVWAPTGLFAITGDTLGGISVWQCDLTGQVRNMFVHRKDGPIRLAICLTSVRPSSVVVDPVRLESGDGEVPNKKDQMTVLDDEGDGLFQSDATFALSCGHAIEVVDDQGNGFHLFDIDKDQHVATLLWIAGKNNIVCLTTSLQVLYYHVLPDFTAQIVCSMKISGSTADASLICAIWAAPGMLITSSGESLLRLWNLDEQDMYLLPLPAIEEAGGVAKEEKPVITCLSFSEAKSTLTVATKTGTVVIWQYNGGSTTTKPEDWDLVASQQTESSVQNLSWGADGALCVTSSDSVRILVEVQLKRKLTEKAMVCQQGVDNFLVQTLTSHGVIPVRTTGKIRGLDVLYPHVCMWTGKKVELYQVNDVMQTANLVQSMDETSVLIALSWQGIFVARPGKVELFTLQLQRTGTPLPINESEGDPVAIDANDEYLAVATDRNSVRVWRLGSGRDVRIIGPPREVLGSTENNLEISSIRVNARGKKVAVMASRRGDSRDVDTRVWVYDLDVDRSIFYDFGIYARYPTFMSWMSVGGDATVDIEHTMLCCEVCKYKSADDDIDTTSRLSVSTIYATLENGAILQSSMPLPPTATCFVGLYVPQLFFYCKRKFNTGNGRDTHLLKVPLHDLEGIIVDGNLEMRAAMLNFSYNLTIGNMDEAYRFVKSVKDESVWASMAAMCVKTRRLDVAEVCLGNMQDPLSTKILKASYSEPEVEARVASLAICLGMVEEAEKLYRACGRFDLLNKLQQYCGKYDAAIETAEKYDRIHLRTTKFIKARYLESRGDLDGAAKLYEASNCHRTEVPRMYFENRRVHDLQQFVSQSRDSEFIGWWGQYQESQGNIDKALDLYEHAGDVLSRVRLLCGRNPPALDAALALVQATAVTTAGKAAAYHLARHFEEARNVPQAIELFSLAGAVKHTIRIARENDQVAEVMTQSLKSTDPGVLLDSAQYFEERGLLDKAVMLYHKGGDLQKAISLCIRAQLFETLQSIAENLDTGADPEVFQSCAAFFISHGQFSKAVAMLTQAKAYGEALQLCIERGVKLTDELAEHMTLPKTENEEDEEYRISILKKIAKVAKMQESWHLACKKYTQAGDKVKAMKMLLRSGDTEKVIFFANHARQKELFVLAANFLQSRDWQNDPNIYKNILLFYNKAHAYENLAVFYDTCSQLQIDEYRDYEKASVTLKESAKCLEKCNKADLPQNRIGQIKARLQFVEKFAQARRLASQGGSAGAEMVSLCQDLLSRNYSEHPEYEVFMSAVRVGDVYALLVEHYVGNQQWESAYAIIEKMREFKIELTYYLEQSLVETVFKKMGKVYKPVTVQPRPHGPGSPNAIDEEVGLGGEDED